MSKLEVDAIEPQSGTTLTLGASGDTITIPSGATLTNSGTATGFGKLLQVATQSTTSELSTSSATYINFTALGVTLTTSKANSKLFCVLNLGRLLNTGVAQNYFSFTDGTNNSTQLSFYSGYPGTGLAINPSATGIIYGTHSAGASLTIYPRFKTSGGTYVIGDSGATSSLYVMEIE